MLHAEFLGEVFLELAHVRAHGEHAGLNHTLHRVEFFLTPGAAG
jgi:hypothetical protein